MAFTSDSIIWNKDVFPQQVNESEDILFITRQDIALLVFKALALASFFVLTLLARTVVVSYVSTPFWIYLFDTFLYGIFLFLVLSFTLIFHNYYLSMQMVTTDRVIDIDQQGIFSREVNELAVDNIQDVTYKQIGFWPVVLGYGNVIIKTASSSESPESDISGFVFENVPSPKDIAAQLSNIYHANQDEEKEQAAELNAQQIREAFNPGLYK